eukprot:g4799.t1
MASDAAAAQAGGGRARINEVWHVRHGERCDEVSGAERRAWEQSPRYRRGGWFDPYLTSYGHVQASRAGLYLKTLPFNEQPGGFDIVYTSPLVRAVQTAVCVSQGLGNLPLQVVPGLCSCTAALVRIGYAKAQSMLMTDAEITRAFPGITVIPRDPLAPATFSGAAAWLAAKASEKKAGAEEDGGDGCERVSRVLAVGHREGTKAMAGERVPTPHCCIGIFRTEASDNTHGYRLHELLSHKGKSLKPNGDSPSYARLTTTTGEDDGRRNDASSIGGDRAVETLAARVMALSVRTEGSRPKGTGAPKHASTGERASSVGRGAAGMVRKIRGASSSSSLVSTTGNDQVPGATSSSGRFKAGKRGKQTKNTALATRKPPRRTTSDGSAKKREGVPGGPSRGDGSSEADPPPPRAQGDGSRRAAAPVAAKNAQVAAIGTAASGGVENPQLVAPPGRACAGGGFRVGRRSSRRGPVGGGSAFAGFLGVPADTLCGESGVLSFLSAPELCAAQATCRPIATAAANEILWRALYSRLPRHLRDRSERGLPGTETPPLHPKILFARSISTASSAHAAKMTQKVAVIRRRLTAIHSLRGSVRSMKPDLRVRMNGQPVGVVHTTGAKVEAWVSRSNLLSEPSVSGTDGVRTFSLSNSLKVDIPASLETVELLRSICVSLSWPDKDTALLPRMPVFRIDSWPVLSQARLLGTSAEGAVALYGVAGSSSRSHVGSVSPSLTRRSGGDGGGDRTASRPSPVLRGCALLGVLPSRRQDGKQDAHAEGFAFLTIHLPHDLVLDVATRGRATGNSNSERFGSSSRRRQSHGDDSAGPGHGLEDFAAALGLRTAGVPLWETASMGVGGCIRKPGDVVSQTKQQTPRDASTLGVVCFDILCAGANRSGGSVNMTPEERTLSAGPGLPFSTPGGLSGVVGDVLLADFTLRGDDGMPLWAFASPIVFEAYLGGEVAKEGEGSGGGAKHSWPDSTVDMAHNEVREERRRGIVVEHGVGRVVIELGVVESPGEDGGDDGRGRVRSAASRGRNPAGHVWMVVSARAELELDFINAWFGTNHGSSA